MYGYRGRVDPYTNMQDLNIDWLINLGKRIETTMDNLNNTIDNVVRPIIDSQRAYIRQYYNLLDTHTSQKITAMQGRLDNALDAVNSQMYTNRSDMHKLRHYVDETLQNTVTQTDIKMSKLQNKVDIQLRKQNVTFNQLLLGAQKDMTALKNYVDTVEQQIYDNVEDTYKQIQNELVEYYRLYASWIEDIKGDISVLQHSLGEYYTSTIELIAQYFTTLNDTVTSMQHLLNAKIDTKADATTMLMEIARLDKRIDDIKLFTGYVINPVTQRTSTIQEALDDIYKVLTPFAITAGEYDDLHITAGEYDDLMLTAEQYDTLGKWYLYYLNKLILDSRRYTDDAIAKLKAYHDSDISDIRILINDINSNAQKCCNDIKLTINKINNDIVMISPFSGKPTKLKDVILEMLEVINTDAITAGEYDDLALTAGNYDDKNITAYDYDWYGKTILGGN